MLYSHTDSNVHLANSVLPNYVGELTNFGDLWFIPLSDPTIQVRYSADAKDSAGQSVCGKSIPEGTTFTARFAPHTPQDVQWFVTGGKWDTPNGAWTQNAEIESVACNAGDQVSSFNTVMWGSIGLYTPFRVNPPAETLSVQSGGVITCDTSQVSTTGLATCTAASPGDSNIAFNYGPTYGKFYFRARVNGGLNRSGQSLTYPACVGYLPSARYCGYWGCQSNNGSGYLQLVALGDYEPMVQPQGTYHPPYWSSENSVYYDGFVQRSGTTSNYPSALNHSTPYQVNIPEKKIDCGITVTPSGQGPDAPAVSSGGSCTVGTPYSISFTSTDPNGHQLKYGIDWDGDGTIDQFVPPSGYVSSGTTQSASRLYSIAGQKQIRVVAINDQGAQSSWATDTFTCTNTQNACPAGYILQDNSCVLANQCANPPRCSGNDLVDSCTGATIQTCSYGCRSGACVVVAPPSATLHATPSLVRSSNTTSVSWSSSNTASCTVHGTNGDSWAGTSSSGKTSSPIIEQTIYTLHCIGVAGASPSSVDKSVTVNLLPKFSENCSPGFVFVDGHCVPQ